MPRSTQREPKHIGLALAVVAVVAVGCRVRKEEPAPPPVHVTPSASTSSPSSVAPAKSALPVPEEVPEEVEAPQGSEVVAIGGVDTTPATTEPLVAAVRVATARLVEAASALDAAVDGVTVLEDSPDLNAGIGSNLRFDGTTIECDAAVMSTDGAFAAVGALQRTRNPVRVARAVLDTPHRILVGDGALVLARQAGFPDTDLLTPGASQRYSDLLALLPTTNEDLAFWRDRRSIAPAPGVGAVTSSAVEGDPSAPPSVSPSDTVGVLVRDAQGGFAGAVSSGGALPSLPGRLSDVVVPGAALWVGEHGAVAVSGQGEAIIEVNLAKRVYGKLRLVRSPRVAAEWGLTLLDSPAVVVVLDSRTFHIASATEVAWAENGPGGESSSTPAAPDEPNLASAASPTTRAPATPHPVDAPEALPSQRALPPTPAPSSPLP